MSSNTTYLNCQSALSCLNSTKETLYKTCEICLKLTVKTPEEQHLTSFWCL